MTRKTLLVAAALVSVAVPVSSANAQGGFVDGFESTELDPFWKTQVNQGSVTCPSTFKVRRGAQSIRISTDAVSNGPSKSSAVVHWFARPTYGSASVWFYDTGANVSSANYAVLSGGGLNVGVPEANLGPKNGGSYVFWNLAYRAVHTSIGRTHASLLTPRASCRFQGRCSSR